MNESLLEKLKEKSDNSPSKPVFFELSNDADQKKVAELFDQGKIQHTVDDYQEEQLELFGVKNPTLVYTPNFKEKFESYWQSLAKEGEMHLHGNWVYFPWNSKLVHILEEDDFQLVRTARNKNLITAEEQDKFYNSTVGIGGLSVGSNIAFALALQGGAKHLKLADMDRLALSNTNRILSGVDNLGLYKVDMAARTIYQINPYAIVETFPEGINEDNVEAFCSDLDVMIDELDTFTVKFLIREQCKKNKVAVVMAADNGDNGVLDVERHDLSDSVEYYHGRLGPNLTLESFQNLDKFAVGKMITQLVGPQNVTERMQQSLMEMGKTIVSWPQLGGAALLNGAAVAYCVRKILNKEPLEDNRALLYLDAMLDASYNTPEQIARRNAVTEGFRKMYGLESTDAFF